MVAGDRGTFVISWAQTEIDGLVAAAASSLDVGATWRWTGRAVRVDDTRDILVLENALGADELRRRASVHVRKLLGDPNLAYREITDSDGEDPLFDAGFDVTDGKNRYRATIVELEDCHNPMLLFVGAIPPCDEDLWVVSHKISKLTVHGLENANGMICFVAGTRLLTPNGTIAVEDLGQGDNICTKDDGGQEILWVGNREISGARLTAMPHLRPIKLTAGYLGADRPDPDLFVSPDHRVLFEGPQAQALFNTPEVFVTARDLINDQSVTVDRVMQSVNYIHIMLNRHQVVWANGVECESFHPANTTLRNIAPQQRAGLIDSVPSVVQDAFSYGDFARRNLTRAEAAILSYGHQSGH